MGLRRRGGRRGEDADPSRVGSAQTRVLDVLGTLGVSHRGRTRRVGGGAHQLGRPRRREARRVSRGRARVFERFFSARVSASVRAREKRKGEKRKGEKRKGEKRRKGENRRQRPGRDPSTTHREISLTSNSDYLLLVDNNPANASAGMSTFPTRRILRFPSFCFANSFFFRLTSPP